MKIIVNFKNGDQDIFENVKKIEETNGRCIKLFDYDNKLLSRIDNKYATFTIKKHE